jgi:hypothetical protein
MLQILSTEKVLLRNKDFQYDECKNPHIGCSHILDIIRNIQIHILHFPRETPPE